MFFKLLFTFFTLSLLFQELIQATPAYIPRNAGAPSSFLFPVETIDSWTTAQSIEGALPLSDATLRPSNIFGASPYTYTAAPDGRKALKAHYPQGSYNPSARPAGGMSFYAPGPSDVDLSTAEEATFGYSVFFPRGFQFVKGGKLPGLYGGNDPNTARECSGGRKDDACFSTRLMWRTGGEGETYAYLPPSENKKACSSPGVDCNPSYGASIDRGSFRFTPGAWTTVAQRVKLNDAGRANGEIELFVNGESVSSVSGIVLRDSAKGRIWGLQMQSFFGGSTPDWASPKSQDVYFSDISVGIVKRL